MISIKMILTQREYYNNRKEQLLSDLTRYANYMTALNYLNTGTLNLEETKELYSQKYEKTSKELAKVKEKLNSIEAELLTK